MYDLNHIFKYFLFSLIKMTERMFFPGNVYNRKAISNLFLLLRGMLLVGKQNIGFQKQARWCQ